MVGSPYDFAEQALLYVPRAMPDPRSEGFTARAAEEIVALSLHDVNRFGIMKGFVGIDHFRSLFADPDFVAKLLSGRAAQIRPCVSCNED